MVRGERFGCLRQWMAGGSGTEIQGFLCKLKNTNTLTSRENRGAKHEKARPLHERTQSYSRQLITITNLTNQAQSISGEPSQSALSVGVSVVF